MVLIPLPSSFSRSAKSECVTSSGPIFSPVSGLNIFPFWTRRYHSWKEIGLLSGRLSMGVGL